MQRPISVKLTSVVVLIQVLLLASSCSGPNGNTRTSTVTPNVWNTPTPDDAPQPNSNGAMVRANLHGSGVFVTKGVRQLAGFKWSSTGLDHSANSVPIVQDCVVYFGNGGRLYAIDAETGLQKWNNSIDTQRTSTPAIAGDTIYVGGWMELDALSTQSGTTRWRFQTESGSDDGYLTDPVIYDGIIYVGLRSTLYALDGQSGQVKWKLKLSGAITNATTISDDTVYIGTYSVGGGDDTYLYALDSKTGQEKWKLQVTAGGIVGGIGGAVALVDGVAYVGTTNSGLLSLDAENGQEKWRYYPGSGVTTGPAVAYNTVYVTDRGNLYAVDAQTGKEKWKLEEQGVFYSDPVIADGIVYFTSTRTGLGVLFGNDPDGYLYAADAQSGQELWTLHVPGIASRAPAVADGVVYFGTEAGTFYAVK